MAPVTTPPPPGSMTVPPMFGWEEIVTTLTLLALLAVAFLVAGAAGAAVHGRSEWQAWLDGRSNQPQERTRDPHDRSAELVRTERSR
jgi:hypothetical protein